jgi:hypothetical protein
MFLNALTNEIYNFMYYNTISSTICLSTYLSLEYISDSSTFKTRMNTKYHNILLWILDKIVSIDLLIDPPTKKKKTVMHEVLSYDENGKICNLNDEKCENYYEEETIENKKIMKDKRNKIKNEEIKQFDILSFDVKFKDITDQYDYNNLLKQYYITGNIIDKKLLNAIYIINYDKNPNEIEEISIIDDSFTKNEIKNSDFKIIFTNNGMEIE